MSKKMTVESFQQKAEYLVSDLETLKVLADSLRTQLLETLAMEPLTVKQAADRLGLAPSKLYYHVNLLEQHGLLQVVETRMVANMVEKYYQAVATSFRVDQSLLNFQTAEGKEHITNVLGAVLDVTRADLMRTLEAKAGRVESGAWRVESGETEEKRAIMLTRSAARISERRAEEFRARLKALEEEFDVADDEETADPKQLYALTVAFYPTIYFPEDEAK
jgi:DNA-binding transcriptional ArsR family regulator